MKYDDQLHSWFISQPLLNVRYTMCNVMVFRRDVEVDVAHFKILC